MVIVKKNQNPRKFVFFALKVCSFPHSSLLVSQFRNLLIRIRLQRVEEKDNCGLSTDILDLFWFLLYFFNFWGFELNFYLIISLVLFQFIHVLLPFISIGPCDFIIASKWVRIGHPLGSFLMTLSTIFPISISIERFIAMKTARIYETAPVILGPILVILIVNSEKIIGETSLNFQISIDLILIIFIYKDEQFDSGAISFMIFPSKVAGKMFLFFMVILLLNIINFMFNFFLFRENKRLKKMNISLATKYQLEEVYLSSKFVISVTFLHFSFFAAYLFMMIISGLVLKSIMTPLDIWAFNGVLMSMIATYLFLIGICSVYLYDTIRAKKTSEIIGNIQLKSTGTAGALNYDNAIFSIWNSASSLATRRNV
ncbi:hypothetical protein CRE_25096 [Caenorhabditis remanei]|uniref:Uncharacterized protein n=1 Tax=Caenorhabditis remanei TaxID=31234 RepID=E3LSW4_CAERE|nr:hypothetical protein CRE_25096 [Caenorhabditis remanei]